MQFNKKYLYTILLLVVALAVTVYTLSYMVTSPGTSLVTIGGDGFKNYFSYLYHIANGSGTHFDGMNYPYGEHIVYTDGQPLLSIILSYINDFLPLSYNNLLTILHLAISLSFFLAIVFTYKIVTHFKVRPFIAIVVSVLIVLMSPQLFRIHGHFGLGYQSIVPMLFYWSIKYHISKKIVYAITILFLGIASALLHPYWAAIFFVWLMLYSLGHYLIARDVVKERFKHIMPIALAGLGIIGFVKVFIFLTDTVIDRTQYPYGTLSACTTGTDIFTSDYSTIWQSLKAMGLISKIGKGEGLAYIGIVGLLILVIAIYNIVSKTLKRKRLFLESQQLGFSPLWIFIAFGCFLLAQGVPFVWHMEWLLDHVASFRQFRSLGRFAFLFYYIISVYVVVLLYRLFISLKISGRVRTAYVVLFLPLLVWGVEANGYIISSRKAIANARSNYNYTFNVYDWSDFLKTQWFKSTDFQGIIILPYIHVGSEKLWINGDEGWAFTLGINSALQLKLPIVNVNMSRTSWSQTFKQVRTVAGPYANKPLFNICNQKKPFLLIYWSEKGIDIDSRYLIDMSDHIGSIGQCNAYALYPEKINQSDSRHVDNVKRIANCMEVNDTCIGTITSPYIIDHIDEDKVNKPLFSSGCRLADHQKTKEVKTYRFKAINSDTAIYELSIWSLVNNYDYRTPMFIAETFDSSGAITSTNLIQTKYSVDNMDGWFRASNYFSVPKNSSQLKITIPQDDLDNFIAFDEIVFKAIGTTTISKQNSESGMQLMVNNHFLDNK